MFSKIVLCINGKKMAGDTQGKVLDQIKYSVFNLFLHMNLFYELIGLKKSNG